MSLLAGWSTVDVLSILILQNACSVLQYFSQEKSFELRWTQSESKMGIEHRETDRWCVYSDMSWYGLPLFLDEVNRKESSSKRAPPW